MIEIIKRKEGEKSQKEKLKGKVCQASFNSHGRLCVRIIESNNEDTLVVLDKVASRVIIDFCQRELTDRSTIGF